MFRSKTRKMRCWTELICSLCTLQAELRLVFIRKLFIWFSNLRILMLFTPVFSFSKFCQLIKEFRQKNVDKTKMSTSEVIFSTNRYTFKILRQDSQNFLSQIRKIFISFRRLWLKVFEGLMLTTVKINNDLLKAFKKGVLNSNSVKGRISYQKMFCGPHIDE